MLIFDKNLADKLPEEPVPLYGDEIDSGFVSNVNRLVLNLPETSTKTNVL